jgi:predicted AAA+ superfamily ATPase
MIIQRDLIHSLQRFLKRREYIAIVGPRQAGKTTFLEIIQEYLFKNLKVNKDQIQAITFEDRRLLAQFDADPLSFVRSYLPVKPFKTFYLMIDEFQYSQEGGQKLKLIYDTVKNLKIIITGSSSLDIKAQVSRYLVGRILTFNIHPFNFGEFLRAKDSRLERIYQERNKPIIKWLFENKPLGIKDGGDVFSEEMVKRFEEFSIWGGYPAVVLSKTIHERKKVLNDIYNNYILKDIKGLLELATEKSLFLLSQYLATQIGNILIYQNLGQVSHLDYRQTRRHLNILNETFICTEVKPFFKNRQKELSKNPKPFFYDMGFRNNLMENMNSLDKHSDSGAVIENAVFIRLNELCHGVNKINFWRTKAGAEIDFVLHISGEVIPIEVKYSQFDKGKIPRSFMSFVEAFKPPRGIILTKNYRGKIIIGKTKILFIPAYYL